MIGPWASCCISFSCVYPLLYFILVCGQFWYSKLAHLYQGQYSLDPTCSTVNRKYRENKHSRKNLFSTLSYYLCLLLFFSNPKVWLWWCYLRLVLYTRRERLNFYCWLVLAFQTVHEGRIYQLKLFCGNEYPDEPPAVRFQTRINMTCVNQETGLVSITNGDIILHRILEK